MTPLEWANKCVEAHPQMQPSRNNIAKVIQEAVAEERARCRAIANRYEKGPDEQAMVAGTIRQKIEEGLQV